MDDFEFVEPRSLDEALTLLADERPSVRPIAGGTALMLLMRYGYFEPVRLVSLRHVHSGLRGVGELPDGAVRIGAMTTLRHLEESPVIRRRLPVVSGALAGLGNVRVRSVATIGGHLAHADPHMDLPPILLALDARVRAVSSTGSRWIALSDFFAGYYETALAPGEILTEVLVPRGDARQRGIYRKSTALAADDWPMLGIAAVATRGARKVASCRVAVGAVTERPRCLGVVESMLVGRVPSEELHREAADRAVQELTYLVDHNGSTGYKRELLRVQLRRALDELFLGDHG